MVKNTVDTQTNNKKNLLKLEITDNVIESIKGRSIYLLLEENSNIDSVIINNSEIISEIWENFASENNIRFNKSNIKFFKGDIELDKKYNSYIFYYNPDNNIYINRYNLFDIINIVGIDSGLIAIIAHEIGHSIQNSNNINLGKFLKEQHADYLAGFIIRKLVEKGKISKIEAEEAIKGFEKLGDFCDKSFINGGKANGHGNGQDRKSAIERGYISTDKNVINSII